MHELYTIENQHLNISHFGRSSLISSDDLMAGKGLTMYPFCTQA